MPSPFPGMDPYLESPDFWPDVHASFLVYLREHLGPRLPAGFQAQVEAALYVADKPGGRPRRFGVADVGIGGAGGAGPGGGVAVAAAPEQGVLPALARGRRHRWLTIRDRRDRRVVTVIELLSPANKAGAGRAYYLAKRTRVLRSQAALVEIDLLRGGDRMPVTGVTAADYRVLVARPADRPAADVWPVRLRAPLPVVPVPVDDTRPEPTADLRAVLDRVYDAARYGPELYAAPPDPPLTGDDAAWAAGVVAAATG